MATSTEVREAISAGNKRFMETFERGDAAGMATLYTENGQLLPPNTDIVSGRQGIQAFWQGAIDMGIKAMKLETTELEEHGDTAIAVGKYTLSGEGDQVIDSGKYVVILKQEGGQWRLHRDIWNTSMPAPQQK
jgi:uncharacterized protein (TIGR02246 family)